MRFPEPDFRIVRSVLPHQRQSFQEGVAMLRTLIAELEVLNNNVTYTHRPVDSKTGGKATAAVESVPFSDRTKILTSGLFKQVDRRIDVIWRVGSMKEH